LRAAVRDSQVLESKGKLSCHLILSQVKLAKGALVVKSKTGSETGSQIEKLKCAKASVRRNEGGLPFEAPTRSSNHIVSNDIRDVTLVF
jgi:hypothetical protein